MSADLRPAPPRLHFTGLMIAFAVLSVLLVGALAVAPARSHFTEWRHAQRRYNALAARARGPRVAPGIKQLWVPDLGVVDRCSTCHLGVEAMPPVAGARLFAAHPDVPHDPRRIGCTPCHGGEGRATTRREAHGDARFERDAVLPRAHVEAGCATCHSHLPTPARDVAERGRRIFEEVRCRDCHAGARELRAVGLRGVPSDWHDRHVGRTVGEVTFAPLADEEIPLVNAYLATLVGAPRLMAARMLAAERGCRGCHRIQGVGGDVGPDLAGEGRRGLDGLSFAAVRGPRTLPGWLRAHFLAPQRVVAGSTMPRLVTTEAEADLLTTYVLSLRDRPFPLAHTPRDRVRAVSLGARDFPTDGASLYGAFCVGCHGARGEGSALPGVAYRVPPLANPDFLAIADDRFLRETIANGRPGRFMSAWGARDTGLRPAEIDALVAYLRGLTPPVPSFDAVMAEPVDVALGTRLFRENCAGCHGAQGQGSVVAPPLGATDNLATRADNPIYGTLAAGVSGTAMGAFRRLDARALRALIATVRALPPGPTPRTGWARQPGDPARGARLYATRCVECHGQRGEGVKAPALRNPAFLAAASDSYLTASVVRGFAGTEMPRFGTGDARHARLTPAEVADVVAFVRAWAPAPPPAAPARGPRP